MKHPFRAECMQGVIFMLQCKTTAGSRFLRIGKPGRQVSCVGYNMECYWVSTHLHVQDDLVVSLEVLFDGNA